MVDSDGYRPNVGLIIANQHGQVLWARRIGGQDHWQFPQGGVDADEPVEAALFRELHEEVGLTEECVEIVAATRNWLRYRIPRRFQRYNSTPGFKGQKQRWFLLRMLAGDDAVDMNCGPKPEFDGWQWVSYWYPLTNVVDFKREVYRRAMLELVRHLPSGAG